MLRTDGEDVFSYKPALKLGLQFTDTAAETTSPIFPVKRRFFPVKRR